MTVYTAARIILTILILLPVSVIAHGLKEPVYPPYCWVQPPGSDLHSEDEGNSFSVHQSQGIQCLKICPTY